MSIIILRKANSTLRTLDVSVLCVSGKSLESLSDFVRRVRNEKGFSQPEVERRSGYGITDGYISQIENGYIKNVSPDKLRALAKGLGVNEQEVLEIALGKSPNANGLESSEFALMYSKYNRLTTQQKRDFKRVIEMFDRELDRELERAEREGKAD